MTRALPIVVLAAAVSAMSPAAASAQTGTLIDNHPAEVDERDAGNQDAASRITNDFAECVVRKYGRLAERSVAGPASARSAKMVASLAAPECLSGGELRMPQELIRGAIFRALYIKSYGRTVPAGERVAVNYGAEAISGDGFSQRMAGLLRIATCVAQGNPEASRALVIANAATKAEQAAINALRPALANCLPAQMTITFSKPVLQGMLAEALYREAPRASDGVAMAGKK